MSKKDPLAINEKDWITQIIQLARTFHFDLIYHTFFSKFSTRGFPDLVLIKPPRVLFIEAKTETGKISKGKYSAAGRYQPGQEDWLDLLAQCPGVEVYLWRPHQLEEIRDILQGG